MEPLNCINHKDREAVAFCEKTNRRLCAECAIRCETPDSPCKSRMNCGIWFSERERRRRKRRSGKPSG
jgi:hypothetical protein